MRSEFRVGPGSKMGAEENREPRRAKRAVPYFHSPWVKVGTRCTGLMPLHLWEQREGSLGGPEAREACRSRHTRRHRRISHRMAGRAWLTATPHPRGVDTCQHPHVCPACYPSHSHLDTHTHTYIFPHKRAPAHTQVTYHGRHIVMSSTCRPRFVPSLLLHRTPYTPLSTTPTDQSDLYAALHPVATPSHHTCPWSVRVTHLGPHTFPTQNHARSHHTIHSTKPQSHTVLSALLPDGRVRHPHSDGSPRLSRREGPHLSAPAAPWHRGPSAPSGGA